MEPPAVEVLQVLESTGAISLAGDVMAYTLLNQTRKRNKLRYLAIIGGVTIGTLRPMDPTYAKISFPLAASYAIAVSSQHELHGQAALREQHKGDFARTKKGNGLQPSTPKNSKPGSMVKSQSQPNPNTPRASSGPLAWSTPLQSSSIEVANPHAVTSAQAVNDILKKHDEQLKSLQAAVTDLRSTAITRETMMDILDAWEAKKKAKEAALPNVDV